MGLLDNLFMTQTPDYLTSLLGDTGVQDLNKKALTSGIVNTLIGYAAAPKNQRLGLGRILAGAYQQGMTGAQGTVDKATQDYINAQKIGELKQKAEADKAWADIQDKIYTKTPDVTKQVTTAGGYAPSMDQVAPEQATPIPSLLTSAPTQPVPTEQPNLLSAQPADVNAPMDVNAPTVSTAPNFNMVQQPDVTTTQTVAGQPTLNSDLIQQFVTKYPSDERAQKLLTNMEMIKKLGATEKGSHILTDPEKIAANIVDLNGKPLAGSWQIDAVTKKIERVVGTEPKAYTDVADRFAKQEFDKPFNELTQTEAKIVNQKVVDSQRPPTVEEEPLSRDALINSATRYNLLGDTGIRGSGKQSALDRRRAMNLAALLSKGIDPKDLVVDQMNNKAIQSGLSDITKKETSVGAFEKTALKNANVAQSLSDKYDRVSGMPILEAWVQKMQGVKGVTNSPQLAAFNVATETFLDEYSKVTSGSMGSVAVSDTKRARTAELLSKAYDKDAFNAAIEVMKLDMANRIQGFADEKELLKSGIQVRQGAQINPAVKAANTPSYANQTTTPNAPTTTQPVNPTKAYLNNRAIVIKNNQWVYEDTGEAAK
jgi:hypothetical protein